METVDGAPLPLVVLAVGGFILGVLPLFWIGRRLGRLVLRRPQPAVAFSRYFSALLTSTFLLGVSFLSGGLLLTLRGYRAFTHKTHVAEVQCIELAPSKLRLFYVPIDGEGQRGATATYDLDGDEWTVGGDVLRFKPFLTPLGLETVHKITRVEGRWQRAADANAHKATAFDVDGGTSATWLAMYRDGAHGPLRFFVEGVHGQSVSQLPDRRAIYDLFITPNGYVLDKRAL
jgi:hypothetical protein